MVEASAIRVEDIAELENQMNQNFEEERREFQSEIEAMKQEAASLQGSIENLKMQKQAAVSDNANLLSENEMLKERLEETQERLRTTRIQLSANQTEEIKLLQDQLNKYENSTKQFSVERNLTLIEWNFLDETRQSRLASIRLYRWNGKRC